MIGDHGLSGGGMSRPALGTLSHTIALASSKRYTDRYPMTPEDLNKPAPGLGGTEEEFARSDNALLETPKGGAVFSIGWIARAASLPHKNKDNDNARIMANVPKRFVDEEPF